MIKLVDAPAEIIELVDKFERNKDAYTNPSFKEERLKQEFVNPLNYEVRKFFVGIL